jgi:DNA polymerase
VNLNLDFETGATVDLTVTGAYIYAAHPDTHVLCASYSLDDGKTVKRWRAWAGDKMPADLAAALDDDTVEIHAWNAAFERLILRHVVKRETPIRRFRCTMARARTMALPGKLELCAKALCLPQQKGNNAIMMKWCKPLPSGEWADDDGEYDKLCDYCDDDVRTEIAIGTMLRPLSDEEWEDYHINEEINDRGLPLDMDLVRAAQNYAADEMVEINARISMLTRGVVTTVKQHARIKTWLGERLPPGMELAPRKGKISFDRSVREYYLSVENEDVITGDIRDFIQLVHDGGRASTAKFAAMQARSGPDDRLRGAYVFAGAGQTGRFSSTGAQTHNFIRKKLANIEDVVERILSKAPKADVIKAASFDKNGALVFDDGEQLAKAYDMLTIMSRTLRPSIVAPIGKTLVWGDWSSIEAVVLPWLSKENTANQVLEVYASGADLYRHQALSTFNLQSIDQVTKDQRQACKVQILSLGFGGGVGAFQAMSRNYGLRVSDEQADQYKVTWRLSNPWAQRFWNALETAAFNAVRTPETVFDAGRVSYFFAQGSLWCMLPSGRTICYPFAKLETVEDRWGSSLKVTAIKGSFHPAAGSDGSDWPRMTLWGGFQAENVTQAEAASALRYARRESYACDWYQIGDTHDELLWEVEEREEAEAKAAMLDIMTTLPETFAGLPLRAEISSGVVYGK